MKKETAEFGRGLITVLVIWSVLFLFGYSRKKSVKG